LKPKNARAAALLSLLDMESGRYPEEALNEYGDGLARRDRALANALVFGILRYRNSLDWILSRFLKKPEKPLDPVIRAVLRLGFFQLIHLDRVPASAAVNESVNLAREYGPPGSQNLVNGILRAVTRTENLPDPQEADLSPVKKLSLTESHPEWLVDRWVKQFGLEETSALLKANNQIPPLTLRINPTGKSRQELIATLKDHVDQIKPTTYSPEGVEVYGSTGSITQLPGYKEGFFTVQDEASQMIAYLVRPGNGEKVLDACAGLGGKALHLACLGSGAVWALDTDLNRLHQIRPEADRLGIGPLAVVQGDLLNCPFQPESFQAVLVDAPCSNLGIIRRRPDVKWLKSASDPERMAKLQLKLLEAASRLVSPRGRLVYSVCTITPEETQGCVNAFRLQNENFDLVSALNFLPSSAQPLVGTDGTLQTWPHKHRMDGFFAAVLIKS